MCSFQLDFKRARGFNYGIPRVSQNKMKRLYYLYKTRPSLLSSVELKGARFKKVQ